MQEIALWKKSSGEGKENGDVKAVTKEKRIKVEASQAVKVERLQMKNEMLKDGEWLMMVGEYSMSSTAFHIEMFLIVREQLWFHTQIKQSFKQLRSWIFVWLHHETDHKNLMERILQDLISTLKKLLVLLCWLMSVVFHAIQGAPRQNVPGTG